MAFIGLGFPVRFLVVVLIGLGLFRLEGMSKTAAMFGCMVQAGFNTRIYA